MSDVEAGPSSHASRPASTARRRSSAARSSRPRVRGRGSSTVSVRSDSSAVSSGVNRLSWSTGDCYDYVEEDKQISAFLRCPICLGPFFDPYVSDICSHTFCKRCITLALAPSCTEDGSDAGSSVSKCPTCRNKVRLEDFKPTALLIKNMVDTLCVSCPNKTKGCSYLCERHLLRGHVVRECEFEYVDQDLTQGKRCGCSEKVMRKDWHDHGLTCLKRRVQCSTCDTEFAFDELDDHCKTCSPEPVSCPYCNLETIKSRLPLHVIDCPCAPVTCVHAVYGCPWSGPRWQLQTTDASSGGHLSQCPLEPLKAFFAMFAQQCADLKSENLDLRRRLDDVENRQRSQSRRTDDVMHSIGSWYRSAGDIVPLAGQRARGSQVGVDGEWDEFPLDAQNWERPTSQPHLGASALGSTRRFARSQSASAALAPDTAEWMQQTALRQDHGDVRSTFSPVHNSMNASSYFGATPPLDELESISDTAVLLSQESRSVPSSSRSEMAYMSRVGDPRRESDFANHRRTVTASVEFGNMRESAVSTNGGGSSLAPNATTLFGEDGMDRTNLDSALTSLGTSVHALTLNLSNLDKRSEDSHVTAVKASFESARAQEEVQSLRHALHAIRMQIHQMLMMHQQRYAIFSPAVPATSAVAVPGNGSVSMTSSGLQPQGMEGTGPSLQYQPRPAMRDPPIPLLTPPLLMRRWGGFDQTKL